MTDHEMAKAGRGRAPGADKSSLQRAMEQMHELAHKAFKLTDLRDAEGLKIARQFASVTDDFEAVLKRMVEGGKLAQINIDKHRTKAPPARWRARFSGSHLPLLGDRHAPRPAHGDMWAGFVFRSIQWTDKPKWPRSLQMMWRNF